jgi:hypothetical protein
MQVAHFSMQIRLLMYFSLQNAKSTFLQASNYQNNNFG